MKNTKEQTRTEKIEEFLTNLRTEIDVLNCISDLDEINDFDELFSQIQENGGFDIDIIYYYNAMKYLSENDTSLQESLEIANEFGYETENLNSELLASLLASRNAISEFYELENEINYFFSELEG